MRVGMSDSWLGVRGFGSEEVGGGSGSYSQDIGMQGHWGMLLLGVQRLAEDEGDVVEEIAMLEWD